MEKAYKVLLEGLINNNCIDILQDIKNNLIRFNTYNNLSERDQQIYDVIDCYLYDRINIFNVASIARTDMIFEVDMFNVNIEVSEGKNDYIRKVNIELVLEPIKIK